MDDGSTLSDELNSRKPVTTLIRESLLMTSRHAASLKDQPLIDNIRLLAAF